MFGLVDITSIVFKYNLYIFRAIKPIKTKETLNYYCSHNAHVEVDDKSERYNVNSN